MGDRVLLPGVRDKVHDPGGFLVLPEVQAEAAMIERAVATCVVFLIVAVVGRIVEHHLAGLL